MIATYKDMKFVTVEQAEADSVAEIRELNRTRRPDDALIPEQPMGFDYLKWRQFVALMDSAEDRLRFRRIVRAGQVHRVGFQIVRGARVRASYMVRVSGGRRPHQH